MDGENKKKLVIGFITYGDSTAKYLPYFLPSLKNQTFADYGVLYIDNTDDGTASNQDYIKKNFPEVAIIAQGSNLGFARAYNLMINKAVECGGEYFLAVNPDIILEPEAIAKLISGMEKDNKLGSASPKILKWDFTGNKKVKIIDSLGIKLLPGLRFVDLGQGEEDKGQFDNENILGPSGACAMYKVEALKKIANNSQYFDELMFMYKEDCDLAYRLKLAGYKSLCVTNAIAYHDRTVASQGESIISVALNRKNKSRQQKKWSFVNQQLILWKFWETLNWKNKLALVWNQLKILFFITFFEPYLYRQLPRLYRLRKEAKCYKI